MYPSLLGEEIEFVDSGFSYSPHSCLHHTRNRLERNQT